MRGLSLYEFLERLPEILPLLDKSIKANGGQFEAQVYVDEIVQELTTETGEFLLLDDLKGFCFYKVRDEGVLLVQLYSETGSLLTNKEATERIKRFGLRFGKSKVHLFVGYNRHLGILRMLKRLNPKPVFVKMEVDL